MNTEREKIVAKIKALLAKTEENGCTEQEAFAALTKARAMMDAYEVTAEDVELKGETAEILRGSSHDPHGVRGFLATAIARFTDCRCWEDKTGATVFCGLPADTQLADWMVSSLSAFVLRELTQHLMTTPHMRSERKRIINGFTLGAVRRINDRLNELCNQSAAARTGNGRALVVAKSALVQARMAQDGIILGRASSSRRKVSRDSFGAGQAAGNRASFGRPVGAAGGGYRLT